MQLGQKLNQKLKELGFTQRQLAEKSGLTQPAVNKYIRNKAKPSYETIETIAKVLQVHPGWFFPQSGPYEFQPTGGAGTQGALHGSDPKRRDVDIIVFPSSGKIARGTTLGIGHHFPMQQFPPPNQARYAGPVNSFYTLIFNSLVEYSAQLLPRATLAIDWELVEKRWMFRLRPNVRFHDEKPLTVEDVRWSYDQYLQGNPHERWIEDVEIVDSGVIALHLKAQCPLSRLAMPYILPQGMKPSPDQWLGTGPFKATSLEAGIWRLQSNPHYFLGKPFLGEIIIQEYPDPHALEIALISGEVHFAIGIDAPGEDFVVKREADVQRFHLHFLMKEELVQNLVLRKAIALGLDREALARAAGLKEPHYSAGPFDYLLNERLSQPPLPPDPQTTRFLLKSMSNLGDSVFRVKCYTNDPRERLLEEVLVEQLNGLGIPTQAGKPPHAVLTCRGVGTFELESRLWASTSSPAYNFGYSNPKVDELIRQCVNSEPAPALLRQLRRLIQQDMPDIPLFYDELSVTYVKQLQALENRIILLAGLNEIHTWYFSVNEDTEQKERALD